MSAVDLAIGSVRLERLAAACDLVEANWRDAISAIRVWNTVRTSLGDTNECVGRSVLYIDDATFFFTL